MSAAPISPTCSQSNPITHVAFEWNASGELARVDVTPLPYEGDTTRITIVENGWPMDAKGVRRALQQTPSWTDFIWA
jgi:hypothetical protein